MDFDPNGSTKPKQLASPLGRTGPSAAGRPPAREKKTWRELRLTCLQPKTRHLMGGNISAWFGRLAQFIVPRKVTRMDLTWKLDTNMERSAEFVASQVFQVRARKALNQALDLGLNTLTTYRHSARDSFRTHQPNSKLDQACSKLNFVDQTFCSAVQSPLLICRISALGRKTAARGFRMIKTTALVMPRRSRQKGRPTARLLHA